MPQWIALLRGINVGGHNRVPMQDLRALADDLWTDTPSRSYIASGNLLFEAEGDPAALATRLGEALTRRFGITVPVLVLGAEALREMTAGCPYAHYKGNLVHGFFCFAPPKLDQERLAKYRTDEEITVTPRVIWLHTPSGIGTSKLAENIHATAGGVPLTARNLNTCRKLVEMLDG